MDQASLVRESDSVGNFVGLWYRVVPVRLDLGFFVFGHVLRETDFGGFIRDVGVGEGKVKAIILHVFTRHAFHGGRTGRKIIFRNGTLLQIECGFGSIVVVCRWWWWLVTGYGYGRISFSCLCQSVDCIFVLVSSG